MSTNFVTTTELRTKVPNIIQKLSKGDKFTLIHRSKIIGEITPKETNPRKLIDPNRFTATLKKLEPKKKMTHKQIMKIYEHYMMYRHGPRVS